MLDALAPWFAAADRLAPDWRRCLGVSRIRLRVRDTDVALELRETLELIAYAIAIDGIRLIAVARNEQLAVVNEATHPFRLRVVFDKNTQREAIDAFFSEWSEASASTAFKTTLAVLKEHASGEILPSRFIVKATLKMPQWYRGTDVARIGELLRHLNDESARFSLDFIKLNFAGVNVDPDLLTQLFNSVEAWRQRGTNVDVKLKLPGAESEYTSFPKWRHLFGLVASRGDAPSLPTSCSGEDGGGRWCVDVKCSDQDPEDELIRNQLYGHPSSYWTTPWHFAACLLPLVRADVTSISLSDPFEDTGDEYYDRRQRTSWVALLLRFGLCPTVSIKFAALFHDVEDTMAVAFQSRAKETLLESLWDDRWDSNVHTNEQEFSPDNRTQFHEDVERVVDKLLQRGAEHGPGKRLSLKLTEHDQARFIRFAGHMGPTLVDLDLHVLPGLWPISSIGSILCACPVLTKLTMRLVGHSALDLDTITVVDHPLKSLTLWVCHMDALENLPKVMTRCGVKLESLCLSGPLGYGGWMLPREKDPSSIVDSILVATSPSLTSLKITGLPIGDCGVPRVWACDRALQIQTLGFDGCAWGASDWEDFLAALRDDTHPTVQSLHTLVIRADRRNKPSRFLSLFDAVDVNRLLVNVSINCSAIGSARMELEARVRQADGVSVQRRKDPLSIAQKTAFLGAIEKAQFSWDTEGMSLVLAFAAPTETRQVVFSAS